MPSEAELVAQYGIARLTVREAIGSLVQEGLLERFQGKGTFVTTGNVDTRDIAFVLCGRDYTDPLFSMTLRGAEMRCQDTGYRLVYSHCEKIEEMRAVQNRLLDHRPVCGLVVTGLLDLKWMMHFIDLNANVVLVGDVLGRIRTPDVVLRVIADDEGPGKIMEYLMGLGHRRIAHITGDLDRVWFREPYEFYIQCLKDHGIPPDEKLVVACSDERLDNGYDAAKRLLSLAPRPTAIFTSNDRFAWGAIRAIREAQLRVPEEISVASMGDLPLGDRRDFLTTTTVGWMEMGAKAVDRVIAGAAGQVEKVVVPSTLAVRQSCAPPVSGADNQ